MARKSRKAATTVAEVPHHVATVFNTAIYARLSIVNSGKMDNGDSIENQISYCMSYLEERPFLKLYEVFTDNGEKGTNFDRPEFSRMMDLVRAGKINCILVKDLSRFGRDYIEAGEYLEKIFPFLGVRFISITDNFDSFNTDGSEESLLIPLKNMINDIYAKDISRKIITSFRARQEKGEFLPGFVPYGYVKSKTVQYGLDIDEEVADHVRNIYQWKAEGVSHGEICRRLNAVGATTPSMRKVQLGIWHAEKYKTTEWFPRSIVDMLKNPYYVGDLVYGRIPKSLYEGVRMHRAPREEWRVISNHHEPIVDRELFERVQAIFAETSAIYKATKDKTQEARAAVINLFDKKIYCGDCGKRMRFIKRSMRADNRSDYYACAGYIDTRKRTCTRHGMLYADVKEAVFATIQQQVNVAANMERLLSQLKGSAGERNIRDRYQSEINNLTRQLGKVATKREGLYESYVEGVLDNQEYLFAKAQYDDQYAALSIRLDEARQKKECFDRAFSVNNEWLSAIRGIKDATELDAEVVDRLIAAVYVFEGKRIEVKLNYKEDHQLLLELLDEMMGKEALLNG